MPSFIRPTFKTAMVAYWFSKRCSACSRFCADSLPIAAIRGRSFRRPWQKLCRNWKPKSSGDRIGRKASRSCHGAGLSNELSHGSIDVVVSPKIGKIYPATPSPFSSSHRSASCCESSAILDNVSGQTLRKIYDDAFIQISMYEPKYVRLEGLTKRIAKSHGRFELADFVSKAEEIINRDEQEKGNILGQNVS